MIRKLNDIIILPGIDDEIGRTYLNSHAFLI